MSVLTDQYRGFARYNHDFNAALYQRLEALSTDQRRRDLGAYFGSIHGTLNHILVADWIWLLRFRSAFSGMQVLHDAQWLVPPGALDQELYCDFADLHAARRSTDELILRWAAQLDDKTLGQTMRYCNSKGQQRAHPLWVAAAHLFNHQTHHRGQITTLMSQMGCDPGTTDFFAYVQ